MNLEQRLKIIFYDDMCLTIVTNGFMHIEKLVEALINAKAIENSNRAYVLADSSKKKIKYFAKIADRDQAELIGEE